MSEPVKAKLSPIGSVARRPLERLLETSRADAEHDGHMGLEINQDFVLEGDRRCEPLIDAQEAARILGIHVTCLKARAAKHEIPGFKIGARWKFRKSVLDQWIQRQLSSSRCSRP